MKMRGVPSWLCSVMSSYLRVRRGRFVVVLAGGSECTALRRLPAHYPSNTGHIRQFVTRF